MCAENIHSVTLHKFVLTFDYVDEPGLLKKSEGVNTAS